MKSDPHPYLPSFERLRHVLGCFAISLAVAAISQSSSAQAASALPGATAFMAQKNVLSVSRPNGEISELQDTFWKVEYLHNSTANFSGIVARISLEDKEGDNAAIIFGAPSYSILFPFTRKLKGLDFFGALVESKKIHNGESRTDQDAFQTLGEGLQNTCCYTLRNGTLTFMDRDRRSLIVFSAVQQQGIENRHWRIAKYLDDRNTSSQNDGLVDAKRPADIIFMNGRVYGSPGCGGWVGTYAISGDILTSNVGTFLGGLCSSDEFAQSYLVEKALKSSGRIQKSGSNVLLRDTNGRAMILLVPF